MKTATVFIVSQSTRDHCISIDGGPLYHKKTDRLLHRLQEPTNIEVPTCVVLICSEFSKRAQKNKNYSFRAFARDLGINPGHLSRILSGKRRMRQKTALAICDKLGLSIDGRRAFLRSLQPNSLLPH